MHDDMIERLVGSLEQNLAIHRRPLYRRLRASLEAELDAAAPPLTMRQRCDRLMALEQAIQRRETAELDLILLANHPMQDTQQ